MLTVLLLALTYLAVIGRWSLADVAVAILISSGVAALFGRFEAESQPRMFARALALPWFFVGVAVELLQGSWTMLLVLTGLQTWKNAGFVEVPYGERSARGALITAFVATASPGSLLIQIDDERRVMLFNVIDARDPDAFRAQLDRFYRRFQRLVIP
ncbi:MAG: Na+/H+ antiporter subunit E [Candidatus Hydrogenedentales bacterium]